jgi:hypothetical protein
MRFAVLVAELAGLACLVLLARRHPQLGEAGTGTILRPFAALARRPAAAVLTSGILGFLVSAAFSLGGVPEPLVLDEFGYLLAADTFASGRLTNPPHPFWVHFESIFVFHQPSYQSKYPPAQGVILALGQLVGGHPIVGVWLSAGLACAAVCWGLQAWLPGRWAFLGGMLCVLRLGVFADHWMLWSRSYWGGMFAVAGGALLFGALRRLLRDARARDSVVLGVGLAILANTRPFEGLVASLPAAFVLIRWLGPQLRHGATAARVVLPLAVVLALSAGAMAHYNDRVTGSPWRLPYLHHAEQYDPVPNFQGQAFGSPKTYRHPALEHFYSVHMRREFDRSAGAANWTRSNARKLFMGWLFVLGPALTLPLWRLFAGARRDAWLRFALATILLQLLGYVLVVWKPLSYLGAGLTLWIYVALWSLRDLGNWVLGGVRVGPLYVRGVVALVLLSFGLSLGRLMYWQRHTVPSARASIVAELMAHGDNHLVLVQQSRPTEENLTWAYNSADIDAQPIVWARYIEGADHGSLLAHFSNRQVWILEADTSPVRLRSHPIQSADE